MVTPAGNLKNLELMYRSIHFRGIRTAGGGSTVASSGEFPSKTIIVPCSSMGSGFTSFWM
jgi:hypothetical protein